MRFTTPRRLVASALLATGFFTHVPVALAEDLPDPTGYALYRVASATGGHGNIPLEPVEAHADAEGGRVVARLPYGDSCAETLTFSWSFDKDIRFLDADESFRMTIHADVDQSCDDRRNAYCKLIDHPVAISNQVTAKLTEADTSGSAMEVDGRLHRIHVKPVDPNWGRYDAYTHTLSADVPASRDDRLWIGFIIEAYSPSGHAVTWQAIYLWRAERDALDEDDLVIDNPDDDPSQQDDGDPVQQSDDEDPVQQDDADDPSQQDDDVDPVQQDDDVDPVQQDDDEDPVQQDDVDDQDPRQRTILAEDRAVEEDQQVVVPVRLFNPDGVANIDYSITYDPSVAITEGAVIKGSLLGAARMEANAYDRGRILIAFAQESGLDRDGVIANIVFRAVGEPGDETPLTIAVTDIDDPNGNALSIERVDGRIEILGANEARAGDCDYDDELTMADVICALQMAVGLMDIDLNVDVTGDGRVTSGDARQILQMIP